LSFKPIREVPQTANFKGKTKKLKKNANKFGRLEKFTYICRELKIKQLFKNKLLIKKQKLWEKFLK